MSDIGGDPPCWAHLLDDEHDDDDASECSGGGVIADLGDVTMRERPSTAEPDDPHE